ncbi:MAG TPA: ligase [Roseiflexaceae bacterium]|nr:ligase [Roseiflexaceae bacterium]
MSKQPMVISSHPTARRLPPSAGPADLELAGGPALLAGVEQTGVPALRWYGMSPPALIVGSSQRLDEIDHAACASAGLRIHRRRSGGGAVLSADMLMLDLVLPRAHPLYMDDVTESYRWIGEVWAMALRDLGVDASVTSVGAARADSQALDPLVRRVCFGGLSPYEVVVGQRKLVGLAQVRRRRGVLYQVGIYLRWAPQRTAALLAAMPGERVALEQQLAARVAGLGELLDAPSAEVIAAFESALARLAGLALSDDAWNDSEIAARAAESGRYMPIDSRSQESEARS